MSVTHLIVSLHSNAQIDGNRPKEVIFKDVDSLLSQVQKEKVKTTKPGMLV